MHHFVRLVVTIKNLLLGFFMSVALIQPAYSSLSNNEFQVEMIVGIDPKNSSRALINISNIDIENYDFNVYILNIVGNVVVELKETDLLEAQSIHGFYYNLELEPLDPGVYFVQLIYTNLLTAETKMTVKQIRNSN